MRPLPILLVGAGRNVRRITVVIDRAVVVIVGRGGVGGGCAALVVVVDTIVGIVAAATNITALMLSTLFVLSLGSGPLSLPLSSSIVIIISVVALSGRQRRCS